MWKKITLVSLCLGLVVGCGDKDSAQVKAIHNSAGDGKQQVAEQKSGTAIYLPGGVGVDFGLKPEREVVSEDKLSKVKVISYKVSDSVADIDKSLWGIFEPLEYTRKVNKSSEGALSVTYKKIGGQRFDYFNVNYKSEVREGFEKHSLVAISWRFDFE